MYENFVGTWETVRNREVSVLERCPHGEVRLYYNHNDNNMMTMTMTMTMAMTMTMTMMMK